MGSLISGSIARKGGSINDGPRLDPSWFPDWFHADLPEKERGMTMSNYVYVLRDETIFETQDGGISRGWCEMAYEDEGEAFNRMMQAINDKDNAHPIFWRFDFQANGSNIVIIKGDGRFYWDESEEFLPGTRTLTLRRVNFREAKH